MSRSRVTSVPAGPDSTTHRMPLGKAPSLTAAGADTSQENNWQAETSTSSLPVILPMIPGGAVVTASHTLLIHLAAISDAGGIRMRRQNGGCFIGNSSGERINHSRSDTCEHSRRDFLATLAALGLAGATPIGSLIAKTVAATTKPSLIDVHHHFFPPFYLSENRDRIATSRGGEIDPAWLSWSPEQAIAAMDKQGVATAVVCLPTPGVWFGDPHAAAQTARRANEYAADLAQSHPGRFGLFAAIPLPDTEGSLREIEYAFNVLKADGIGLVTSYDDKWLGDAVYDPVFEELNRRKAVVFVHPTTALCCRTLMPDVSPLVVEIPQDTTRAVTNLLFTGTFARFKNIHFIFAHAGGSVPMVLGRIHRYAPKNIAAVAPNGIEYELKRLYYDIAGTVNRPAIAALTSFVPTRQIVFGSDNPFVPLAETAEGMMQLGFSANDLQRIGRDNALNLLPRLKAI